jgi:hypothetical protein
MLGRHYTASYIPSQRHWVLSSGKRERESDKERNKEREKEREGGRI